jgi:hypothetical protein
MKSQRNFVRSFYPIATAGLITTLAAVCPVQAADAVRGDFWLDAGLHFRTASGITERLDYAPDPAVSSDRTIKIAGDASVGMEFASGTASPMALLLPGPYVAHWKLGEGWHLDFQVRSLGSAASGTTPVLLDAGGRVLRLPAFSLTGTGDWQSVTIPVVPAAGPGSGFDFSRVTRIGLEFGDKPPSRIWLDAVRLVGPGAEIALTDLTTQQRIADEELTRQARITEAMNAIAASGTMKDRQGFFYYAVPNRDASEPNLQRLFAKLELNEDLEQTNAELLAIYASTDPKLRANYGLEYTWDLLATPTLCRLYLNFGSKSKRHPGRLTAVVEKTILELLWERTQFKNDIHVARQSTWNLTGSENHDINAKIGNVLASQIFMHEPDFSERALPDRGTGPGYGYWFHKTTAAGRFHGPEGLAPRQPPGNLKARDHYQAWVKFMTEYIRERARRGFFVEKASPTYMRYTVSFLQDLYDYCEDAELKKLTGMFLDLVWAEWAQDQIAGARGGAKTRDHGPLTDFRQDAMYQMATFLFGGPARFSAPLSSFWLTSYRPPAIVWNLVLNREALGTFAYISRTPGEEPPVQPRPPGMERTLMTDTDSRLLRYSWVTPDYILGTQMDHPLALHSHLSAIARAQGMTFATAPDAMVFPRDITIAADGKWQVGREALYRSVQQGPVMITQQARWFAAVNPEWFPSQNHDSRPFGVYFSPSLKHVEEEAGWVFVEEGDAYLAVRVAKGEYVFSVDEQTTNFAWLELQGSADETEPFAAHAYTWNKERTLLKCDDRHSPIIFEAGRRADYPKLADFKRHILGNEIKLTKMVGPGWYILSYTSGGKTFTFNAGNHEIPRINGQPLDYSPASTFLSPFISSDYRSGVVTITDRHRKLTLDFNRTTIHETPSP